MQDSPMPRKPVIHEKVVVAKIGDNNPVGEALTKNDPLPRSPMTLSEREEMIVRLDSSISELMDDAEKTYKANCYYLGTTDFNPDYITRLSTNEFFFYTKEPLTLQEFEELQNKIAAKAETLSPGVQLILGSFAVKTNDDKVMNVTPHITCGQPPDFQFIVKSYTSPIDVRYKIPDGLGNFTALPVFDNLKKHASIPQITVNGDINELSFNNIVRCKTPGGTPFITAVDVCLDHAWGIAKDNYDNLILEDSSLLGLPTSHVVVSNSISLNRNLGIETNITHVDPKYSLVACKNGMEQQKGALRKLVFGKDSFRIFEVEAYWIKNNYSYKTSDPLSGRDHKKRTVDLSNVSFQKPESSEEFKNFKSKYGNLKGDHLKTKILEDFRQQIEETTSKKELADLKTKIEASYEYDVLKKAQGWFTGKVGIKTSSEKALADMFKQQEKFLSNTDPSPSIP
ncbi:conserved protein of unknown function (putative substrate of the Dot/Icm secretion system) [Legionella fallonii LLAP-10]|uniref:DrrA phosphatidylinositol 4-phosphate binding domain-containing protein n=2 Tax=Legionella fallonii TaxID=96230 RepID=A0A098G3D5_9GAMM|nr:conserved protein of unknown function (putative substrate of the Dot/Icm secretion system) [Legionella fallonii LLAP-10]